MYLVSHRIYSWVYHAMVCLSYVSEIIIDALSQCSYILRGNAKVNAVIAVLIVFQGCLKAWMLKREGKTCPVCR